MKYLATFILGTLLLLTALTAKADCPSYYEHKTTLTWIKEAADFSGCVVNDKEFMKEIISLSYSHYDGDSKEIVKSLLSNTKAVVSSYYKNRPVMAYRVVGTNQIYFNRAKKHIGDTCSRVNTSVHERLHVLGYKHKGNKKNRYNNINSVPYKVGNIAQKHCRRMKGKPTKKPVVKRRGFWKRFKGMFGL